jgi:hypothetical protein
MPSTDPRASPRAVSTQRGEALITFGHAPPADAVM